MQPKLHRHGKRQPQIAFIDFLSVAYWNNCAFYNYTVTIPQSLTGIYDENFLGTIYDLPHSRPTFGSELRLFLRAKGVAHIKELTSSATKPRKQLKQFVYYAI